MLLKREARFVSKSAAQQRLVGILSATVLVVEVVLMIMLSIFPVVTASLVSHSAEAARCPDWLWVRDSV